ncbi:TPA: peptidase M3 [Aeromonas salmonicida]|uniref:Oligoendopeptidase F n=4 Tax=Aeromonas salmonicida TaxID=645 RepID=A4SIQ0_AERS4|nr:M3 family metallopeptidase [Aeromonas salmonicida]ABO88772.1 oligoendopeptidase F [Aeromonas salmonicida subsp. salmonicida A449]AYO61917.1 peptidase M3 [Aeromonas salmonicida subsp. salmonicida 01-B526]EHI52999.1 oligoendopeptidase F [Aeromonas salmonicida subsp. salmonicida 01-B526]EKP0238431.1 peptidase M3 [Aeromonas salmonicida]EKP0242614.1 peptidase M3 [Aeromonas salmonicida]
MHSIARNYLNQLNADYLQVHRRKEDLFWSTYMGTSDDQAGFTAAEQAYKAFCANPARLPELREMLSRAEEADLKRGLGGWIAFFECNVIEDPAAAALMDELVAAEAALFARRRELKLSLLDEQGQQVAGSLPAASTSLAASPNEAVRQSALAMFHTLEQWVVDNGFLEVVAIRNRFARAMGYRDYFDYKVRKNEQMSPEQLFAVLDDFIARTEQRVQQSLAELKSAKGEAALQPHNLRYFVSGDVTRQLDPYVPFSRALKDWVESFRRLGIQYRDATLTLDLLTWEGKYENGFCHGPVPSFWQEDKWVPAVVNFTSLANPVQVGSGWSGLNTLFHEGGHAAHFANVTGNAPCFSQEFPPTSMAYAETQSMFCDSLLDDADWLKHYARNAAGEVIPDSLIKAMIAARQPFRAFNERQIALVSYFERDLYAMEEIDRTPDAVLALARQWERKILGTESPRPLLAIPHLLNQESACAYHGYLLALMAVEQTRAYFLQRDGYLTDNPRIGPDLAAHYWGPGNGMTHDETLRSLTGEGFSAVPLAEVCNQSVADAWAQAQACMAAAQQRPPAGEGAPLNARIRVVHGSELIADNSESEARMLADFEGWIRRQSEVEPATQG